MAQGTIFAMGMAIRSGSSSAALDTPTVSSSASVAMKYPIFQRQIANPYDAIGADDPLPGHGQNTFMSRWPWLILKLL
jgi:hypothetical protein